MAGKREGSCSERSWVRRSFSPSHAIAVLNGLYTTPESVEGGRVGCEIAREILKLPSDPNSYGPARPFRGMYQA